MSLFDQDLSPELTADNGFQSVEAEGLPENSRSRNLLKFYHIIGSEREDGALCNTKDADDTDESDSESSRSSSEESNPYAYTISKQELAALSESSHCPNPRVSQAWKMLAKSSLAQPDHPMIFQNRKMFRPFQTFLWKHKRVYLCKEHIYRASSNSWRRRKVLCRLNLEDPIGEGAMRKCYEVKIMRKGSKTDNWCFDFYNKTKLPLQDEFPLLTQEKLEEFYSHCDSSMPTPSMTLEQFLSFLSKHEYENILEKLGLIFDNNDVVTDCCNRLQQYLRDRERFYEHWNSKSLDYVAKVYKMAEDGPPDARNFPSLKWDTKMQEVCKELTLAYNSYNPPPPKSIDMLHMGIVELPQNRETGGLKDHNFIQYEAFIEGSFHKWNSNTGWIDDKIIRHTPHAFSFFSFRYTGGMLMVVDIQGINDLFTDPQICTFDGKGFGRGNSGLQGMALFMNNFRYDANPIVQYMGLRKFKLCDGEQTPPSDLEKQKFEEGMEYLRSQEWIKRSRNVALSAQTHIDNKCSYIHVGHLQVLEPPSTNDKIPSKPLPEALIHRELALLHQENHPDVVKNRSCSSTAASNFHFWMAALGGCIKSMNTCAHNCKTDKQTSAYECKWYVIASSFGDRTASCKAAEIFASKGNSRFALIFFKKALVQDDRLTDDVRCLFGKRCSYEIHIRIAELLIERDAGLNREEALLHLEKAKEAAQTVKHVEMVKTIEQKLQNLRSVE